MTSSVIKHICAVCNKGAGIATCNGCQRAFCIRHFGEHRQELSQQMEEIVEGHDLLRQDLNYERNVQPLVERINQWEQESIRMIQASAQKARIDLQQVLEQTKNESKVAVNRLTEELRACRESDDYTELDIRKWAEQLRELRQIIENSSNINIECGNSTSSAIPLIRISSLQQSMLHSNQERQFNRSDTRIVEKFSDTYGNITLSADGLTGYSSGNRWEVSCISGIGRYSSGIHRIRFQIENKVSKFLFYGIITAAQNLMPQIPNVKSAHGWWELGFSVIEGKGKSESQTKNIDFGDQLTLTLNCDNRLIQFEHHRTNKLVAIPVDLEKCPFPWKIIIRLDNQGDCIKILH
jgi:hypothetical protein